MKLLRDFPRLCVAGIHAVFPRRAATARTFTVTVPAPLAEAVRQPPVVLELPRASTAVPRRREPALLRTASRQRRLGASRC